MVDILWLVVRQYILQVRYQTQFVFQWHQWFIDQQEEIVLMNFSCGCSKKVKACIVSKNKFNPFLIAKTKNVSLVLKNNFVI